MGKHLNGKQVLLWSLLFMGCQSQDSSISQILPTSAPPGSIWTEPQGSPLVIRNAQLFETRDNQVYVRVILEGSLGLALESGPDGWNLDPQVKVTDVINFHNRNKPEQRESNLTSVLLLTFEGNINPENPLTVSHEALGLKAQVDTSRWPRPTPPLPAEIKARLPWPILPEHPEWIELYEAAWTFLHEKVTSGQAKNGFVDRYLDEGFNENIYQWDSCFMVAFAMYGGADFPAMPTLDNFYNHQTTDGYICRCYNENTGLATGPRDINPPLFAWIEERYWRLTGDTSRLKRVLPILDNYWHWIQKDLAAKGSEGLTHITDFGSGMDNSPREEWVKDGAWVDLSAQQALAARSLGKLASAVGDLERAKRFDSAYTTLIQQINTQLWDEEWGLYLDRLPDGTLHRRKTIASFWTLLAGVADPNRAERMIAEHLRNPQEFYRPHLFPTLAADDPEYSPNGHYWRGGVWAPTTYMTIKGLSVFDPNFAFEAALNHIQNLNEVFHRFDPKKSPFPMPTIFERNIARNGHGTRQIWESYSPEAPRPGTRWDNNLLVRQKFVGWSGLGPIALLLEEVLGLEGDGAAGVLTWTPRLTEAHGVQRYAFGGRIVDLRVETRKSPTDPLRITGRCSQAFTLVIKNPKGQELGRKVFPPGAFSWNVTP